MFLKHEMNDNELLIYTTVFFLLNLFLKKQNILQQSTETLFYYDYNFECNR